MLKTNGNIDWYLAEFARLTALRTTTETYWQDVSDYELPKRDFLITRFPGQRRMNQVYDTIGIDCVEKLASNLQSSLTNQTQRWFGITTHNPQQTSDSSYAWLSHAEDMIYRDFSSGQSKFYTNISEVYLDIVAFGMGVMYVDRMQGQFRFMAQQLRNCYVDENVFGVIDTLFRKMHMTPQRMKEFFSGSNGADLSYLERMDNRMKIEIVHAVHPNPDSVKFPFKSCYFDVTNKKILREGGYHDFPYICPRFSKRAAEIYGYGPGMAALPVVRMLNRIAEVTIRGAQKMVDPVIIAPDDGLIGPKRIDPGAILYYRPDGKPPEALQLGGNPQINVQISEYYRSQCRDLFYLDAFQLPQDRKTEMTKYEVQTRKGENLQQLGPMVARLTDELHTPLLSRMYGLYIQDNLLPPPPAQLRGGRIKLQYMTPFSQALKAVEENPISQLLNYFKEIGALDPTIAASAMQNFDMDAITRGTARDIYSVKPEYIKSTQAVAGMRQQQEKQQQSQQQAQEAQDYAKAAQHAGSATKQFKQAQVAA